MKGDTKYELFSKEPGKFSKDVYERVSKIAEELKAHMDTKSFRSKLELVHKVNGKSQDVQKLIADELVRLKFMPEKRGLFSECEVPSLRPDLYLQLGKSGILVEVERGKTTANNMDFLDVWKCPQRGKNRLPRSLLPGPLPQRLRRTARRGRQRRRAR